MLILFPRVLRLLASATPEQGTEIMTAVHDAQAAGADWSSILATILAHSGDIVSNVTVIVSALKALAAIFRGQ